MRYRNHLRKIDHRYSSVVGDHQIEFVEIGMNQSVRSQTYNHRHEFIVDTAGFVNNLDATSECEHPVDTQENKRSEYSQRITIDQLHDYTMSIEIDRFRNRKLMIIESLERDRSSSRSMTMLKCP
jgi:ATP-dependent protease HslVU (ClpYQ) ATPase subunit